jgi:S-adenosylmethionine:tRNA ribosyltransferase-isomerase
VAETPVGRLSDKLKSGDISFNMLISDFDYELPEELIAQKPLDQRDASRMLVLDREKQTWSDSTFSAFSQYLRPSDVVVINNTRVIPARLIGQRKPSGGRVELLLARELEPGVWEALLRPGNRLKRGAIVDFGSGRLSAEVLDDPGKDLRQVRFHCDGSLENLLDEIGLTPLPPYIKRASGASEADRKRYQTVFSRNPGAIAAPTAGLHFTSEVLSEVSESARLVEITLHVGYGTFEPVRNADIEQHSVSSERFQITEEAALTINEAKKNHARIIVIGTTTMRALECAATEQHEVTTERGIATLTIKPGHQFRIADALLTNFHLPRSSLLLLVSAFAGHALVLEAYRHAVKKRYRFYSYGDCMLIV